MVCGICCDTRKLTFGRFGMCEEENFASCASFASKQQKSAATRVARAALLRSGLAKARSVLASARTAVSSGTRGLAGLLAMQRKAMRSTIAPALRPVHMEDAPPRKRTASASAGGTKKKAKVAEPEPAQVRGRGKRAASAHADGSETGRKRGRK